MLIEKPRTVIVATTNAGKLREIGEMLADYPFELSSLRDYFDPLPHIEETGDTFEANARLKARWVYERTGEWALADDSGLEVDHLNGAPGVLSARFAGPDADDARNLRALLDALAGTSDYQRRARFRCVMVLKTGEEELVAAGACEGIIGTEPRGDQGFGYDPVFIPSGFKRTFAQLDPHVKNAISHRGKALLNLRKELHRIHGDHHGG